MMCYNLSRIQLLRAIKKKIKKRINGSKVKDNKGTTSTHRLPWQGDLMRPFDGEARNATTRKLVWVDT